MRFHATLLDKERDVITLLGSIIILKDETLFSLFLEYIGEEYSQRDLKYVWDYINQFLTSGEKEWVVEFLRSQSQLTTET